MLRLGERLAPRTPLKPSCGTARRPGPALRVQPMVLMSRRSTPGLVRRGDVWDGACCVDSARFMRGVAELQWVGLVKSTQRKTDHLVRLVWS